MPFSGVAWDAGKAAKGQSPEAFCQCCLIDLNSGRGEKSKNLCKLPLKYSPDGEYNLNAMAVAVGRLLQVDAPTAIKKKAAKKLLRLYREAGKEPPETLMRYAGE